MFEKLRLVDGVLLHVCILSLPLRISKFPVLLCHSVAGLIAASTQCRTGVLHAFCRLKIDNILRHETACHLVCCTTLDI